MAFTFDIKGRFESFITEFTDREGRLFYHEEIRRMESSGIRSLYISYDDLLHQDPALAEEILINPEVCLKAAEEVLKEILIQISPNYLERVKQLHVRIVGLIDKLHLRSLRTEHLGLLTCFEGIVIGVTEAIPLLIKGVFKCIACGTDNQTVEFPEGIYTPPYQCKEEHCQRKGSLQLQMEKSVFIDWQKITIQERPEELPPGQLPQSFTIHILDDLVGNARPGDRVEVVGILKARATRLLKRGQLATFGKFFQGIAVIKETSEYVDIEINEEEEAKIIDLSKSPYVIEKIRDSLAPSIYGHDLVKEAIASLLFGGSSKIAPDNTKLRGESNILIVGDPGTGKSIHGSESIYVGSPSSTGIRWECKEIGVFIDYLIKKYPRDIISKKETEIVKIDDELELYTLSLNPNTLKTQKSRINEVSRHQTQKLVRIHTTSGRSILATPDHSFSTLVNGHLEVISAENLDESLYLPIARNIQIDESEIINNIDFNETFSNEDLFEKETIRNQIFGLQKNEKTAFITSKVSNITLEPLRQPVNDVNILPKNDWMRTKFDIARFPRNVKLSDEFGRIIGFYLAESNSEKEAIRSTNTEDEIKKIINVDLQKIFGEGCIINKGIRFNQSSINQWFKVTFGTEGENKKLPSMLLTTPLDFRRALISVYFTRKGRIDEKRASISATTKSRSLAYSISDLLATLGIFSSVKTRIIKSGKYMSNLRCNINITGDDLYTFYTHIGFLSSSKQIQLEKFVEILLVRKQYQSRDVIPNFGSLLIDVARTLDLKNGTGSWERNFFGELRRKNYQQRIGRSYLQKIVKKLEKLNKKNIVINKLDWLKILASSDIFWDKITKIETLNKYTTVYDIGTQDGHFIVANGNLIVHNSQILKFVTQLAPRALYTTGKGSTAAGLCISGDSLVLLTNEVVPISSLIENVFEKHKPVRYNKEIEYVNIERMDKKAFHSKNLKLHLNPISRFWRIKSPEELFKIETKTGKVIKLTPETSLLSYSFLDNLIWKPAKFLKQKDRIATTRTFPPDKCQDTSDYLNSDIYWDEVVQVKKVKSENEYVYDLTIPNSHNFIANGFVTHNTAAVIRDQDTGEITLEAGALVLADQGIAMVDEFDKMRPDDRSAIHEAMEQHSISIAKAGIVATLNARTSILAAANPRRGRWNPYKSTAENLNLPSTILSRFDLIFVLEDKPDLKEDHDKATHILNLHKSQTLSKEPPISQDLLRKYIGYARREVHPRLTDEAQERILEYYKELRRMSGEVDEKGPDPIAITPRQLESLVRLSEARAKMRLSDEVSYDDAAGAVNLMNATLEKLAKDTETGKLDIDKYSSGISAKSRRSLDRIDALIDRMLDQAEDDEPVAIKDIIDQAEQEGLSKTQVIRVIDEMTRRGRLFEPEHGKVKKP